MPEYLIINGSPVEVPADVHEQPGRDAIQKWYDTQVNQVKSSASSASRAPAPAPVAPASAPKAQE